jgi:hypothetical protein
MRLSPLGAGWRRPNRHSWTIVAASYTDPLFGRSDSLACPERLGLRCIRMIQGKPWGRAPIFPVPGEGRSAAP